MISGGFGDPSPEELVEQEWDYLHKVAAHAAGQNANTDDAIQEAAVTFWKEASADPGHTVGYYTRKAGWRATDVAHRASPMLGSESDKRMYRPTSVPVEEDSDLDLLLGGADFLSGVEMAYHEGEILRAINTLRPDEREYIYRRFWLGVTGSQVERDLGWKTDQWKKRIRPRLREALAHLISA